MTAALQHGVPPAGAPPQHFVPVAAKAKRRALLIHNPTAGLFRKRVRAALAALQARGLEVELQHTTGPGDARRMARDAPADLWGILIAGGDGTFNEAVNGLVERPPPRPPLGLLPCGTANVLARELGLPLAPDRAAAVLAEAEPQTVHLGRVNGRYFTVMAGVGLDAQVVAGLSPRMKRRLGRVAYTIETLHQMFFRAPPPLDLTADGIAYRGHSMIAANSRYYGGGFQVAPNARATRRGLELCVFEGHGPWATLRQTALVILGRHLGRSDIKIRSVRSIEIEGPEGLPIQADGELVGHLPAVIDAPPEWIQVLMPTWAAAEGEARPAVPIDRYRRRGPA